LASFGMTYIVGPRLRGSDNCDASAPETCGEVSKLSKIVLWGSAAIWSADFFVAYLLGPILGRLDR
jgi:hypothetical protein